MNLWPFARRPAAPDPAPVARVEPHLIPAPARTGMRIGYAALARANTKPTPPKVKWTVAAPMPGVVPADAPDLAQDDALAGLYGFLERQPLEFGAQWLGYPILADLAQRPEYRRISETLAKEMTRKWIKLRSTSDADKSAKLTALDAALKRFRVQQHFRRLTELDGFFGSAKLYIDTGAGDDRDELATPLARNRSKIRKGGLKRFRVIEPMWTYPAEYNASDPLHPGYYAPRSWFVQGKRLHGSRLLSFVSREVPDLLKPAYSFGGLSMTQIAMPYVENWLRTRQSVSDLIHSFSVSGLKTNMQATLAEADLDGATGEDEMAKRMALFGAYKDNKNTMLIDKETEEFFNVITPLGTLDHLQAQSQEQMSSVAGIPLVILLGITPSGLNASTDGEIKAWGQWISANQEQLYTDNLQVALEVVQLSEFGEVDPDITFTYEPLGDVDESQKSTIRKTDADAAVAYINAGVISPRDERSRLAKEETGIYVGLDVDDLPDPPGTMGGEEPMDGDPNAVPGAEPPDPTQQSDDLAPGDQRVVPFRRAVNDRAPALDAEFKESDHTRDDSGKFGSGGGGASKSGEEHAVSSEGSQFSSKDEPNVFPEDKIKSVLEELSRKYLPLGDIKIRTHEGGDALAMNGGKGLDGRHSVSFDTALWSDPKFLAKNAKEWDGLVVDSSPEGTITHEIGHVLYQIIEARIGLKAAGKIVEDAFGVSDWRGGASIGAEAASPYGQEDLREATAEAFVSHHLNRASHPGPLADVAIKTSHALWDKLLAAYAEAKPTRSTKKQAQDKDFSESDHPRGQPENAGQFGSGSGGGGAKKPAASNSPQPAPATLDPGSEAAWEAVPSLNPAWWSALSKGEQKTARSYKNVSDGVNNYLRGKDGYVNSPHLGVEAEALDRLFDKPGVELTQDVLLRRGERLPSATIEQWKDALADGKTPVATREGFVSTSMGDAPHGSVEAERGNVMFEITAAKGTKALGLFGIGKQWKTDKEVLLRKGTTFAIHGMTQDANGRYIVKASVGGPDQAQDKEFAEADHPRGQPENAGQFGPGGGGGAPAKKPAAKAVQAKAPPGSPQYNPATTANAKGRTSGQTNAPSGQTNASPTSRAGMLPTKIEGKTRVQANGQPLPPHIEALKVPPGWADVKFNPDPNAALLATGKDAKGRPTAVYSEEYSGEQAAKKFARVKAMAERFDQVVDKNEAAKADPKTQNVADCLDLVMKMGVRPGSNKDTGAKVKAYGATTIEGRHVVDDQGGVWLRFTGKKGVNLNLPVMDDDLAKNLLERAREAGPDRPLFGVNERELLKHLKGIAGAAFKTKDLRTNLGTATAMRMVQAQPPPADEKAYKAAVHEVAKAVSAKLGNTAAIALQSYIAPEIFSPWQIRKAA